VSEIQYINLGNHWKKEKEDLLPIIDEIMSKGVFVGGQQIEDFENAICAYTGATYCVALNSGTDALICSLVSLGIGPGDEVITPPNSFIASTSSIVHVRAKPVFVDVLPDQSIDPEQIKSAITEKTKAIMPVHLTGRMARMDEIKIIAKSHGLPIIEDSAQSIGSCYNGKMSGRFGDLGCFSTHPLKNLNACGDGGFVITNNKALASKIKSMRNHGLVDRNTVEKFGYVSRMDTLQAGILEYRLKHLNSVIEKRRCNADLYKRNLDTNHIYIPEENSKYFDTFHTFVIQVEKRDKLADYLKNRGIQTAVHYPIPIHLQPATKSLGYGLGDFPVAEKQAENILTLPINQFLEEHEILRISSEVNHFLRSS